jgi:hypothetical protein
MCNCYNFFVPFKVAGSPMDYNLHMWIIHVSLKATPSCSENSFYGGHVIAVLGEVASRSISLLTGKYSKGKQHQLQMKCNTTYKFFFLGGCWGDTGEWGYPKSGYGRAEMLRRRNNLRRICTSLGELVSLSPLSTPTLLSDGNGRLLVMVERTIKRRLTTKLSGDGWKHVQVPGVHRDLTWYEINWSINDISPLWYMLMSLRLFKNSNYINTSHPSVRNYIFFEQITQESSQYLGRCGFYRYSFCYTSKFKLCLDAYIEKLRQHRN